VKRLLLGGLIVVAATVVSCRVPLTRYVAAPANKGVATVPTSTAGLIGEPANGASAPASTGPPRHLADVPIGFPIQSIQSAAYFNQIARPNDLAVVPVRLAPRVLPALTAGQKSILWTSWADAESQFMTIPPGATIICYDPEHWDQTPADEQQDFPGTVKRASAFAHAHGMKLLLAPDLRFDQEHLADIAPYADAILLQGQRLQGDPARFATFMKEMIQTARAANPRIQVFVQVGAPRGTATQMIGALRGVEGDIDGIAIWTNLQTLTTLQDLVSQLRNRPS
jgi:hypothetical protein